MSDADFPAPRPPYELIETTRKILGPYTPVLVNEMRGRDGMAFRLELRRDGVIVAEAHNEGAGGMTMVDYYTAADAKRLKGDLAALKALSVERESALRAHIVTLGKTPFRDAYTEDYFIDELYAYAGEVKTHAKHIRKGHTVYAVGYDVFAVNAPLTVDLRQQILAKKPAAKFFNDLPEFAGMAPLAPLAPLFPLPVRKRTDAEKIDFADAVAEFGITFYRNKAGCYVIESGKTKWTAKSPDVDLFRIVGQVAKELREKAKQG